MAGMVSRGGLSAEQERALGEAADWFALLRSGMATEQDRLRWTAWLQSGQASQQAWAWIERVNSRFGSLPPDVARLSLRAADDGRRRALKAMAILCGAGVVSAMGARVMPWREWGADLRTDVGQITHTTLPDGSGLWLDTSSALDVAFDQAQRRLVLRSGQVLVQTAPDPAPQARPFVIETAQGLMQAVGTRFCVRQQPDDTMLSVFEGAVDVRLGRQAQAAQRIQAGWQVALSTDGPGQVMPADAWRQSWSEGLLVADDMRLDDFLAELARYRHGILSCDPAVAHLRLVGIYPLADPDRTLAAVEATLDVQIRRRLRWWVRVQARQAGA